MKSSDVYDVHVYLHYLLAAVACPWVCVVMQVSIATEWDSLHRFSKLGHPRNDSLGR